MLENNERTARPDLIGIAHALEVDAYWLKTGKGSKKGSRRTLSEDEQTIIAALPLISADMRESWLDAAHKALARSKENAA